MYVATTIFVAATSLPAAVIHPAMSRLQKEANERRVVCAPITKYFGMSYWGGSAAAYKTAAQNIVAGYVPTTNNYINKVFNFSYSIGYPTEPALFFAWCKAGYELRTKQELGFDMSPLGEKNSPWESQEKRYEISGAEQHHSVIQGVAQQDHLVFLAVHRRGQNPRTTLIEFNLNSGEQRIVSSTDSVVEPNYIRPDSVMKSSRVDRSRLSVGECAVYLPGADGVIIFPLNGDTPSLLRSGENLPDATVVSAIEIGETLYLACDVRRFADNKRYPVRGMLLRMSLKGDHQEALTNSERKESLSPLDNCDPYSIEGFLHDKGNNRLYFMISGDWDTANRGIWALNLKSGEITCAMKTRSSIFYNFAPQKDGTIWFKSGLDIMSWDPVEKKMSRLIGNTNRSGLPPRFWLNTFDDANCAAIINGVLYARARQPLCERGLRGLLRVTESASSSPSTSLALEPFLEYPPIFLQEWQGMLVAANKFSLWLLKPNDERPGKDTQ